MRTAVARADDRRLALAVTASLAAHLLLVVGAGDGGPRPAPPAGAVLTATLSGPDSLPDGSPSPAPSEPARVDAAVADAPRVDSAPAARAEVDAARPAAAVSSVPAASAGPSAPFTPGPVDPVSPPQPPLPAAAPGPGLTPGWFAARDLDVLPRPLSPIEFAVPAAARAAGLSGKVELQLSIDAGGQLVDIEVLRADPRGVFEAAALAAFRSARYSPGFKDGRAVRSRIRTVAVFDASALAGSELAR